MSTIANQVLFTLAYTESFQYPSTVSELWDRLVSSHTINQSATSPVTKEQFLIVIEKLLREGKLEKRGRYIGRSKLVELVEIRKKRTQYSKQKWSEVAKASRWLAQVPWIEAVFITGSLAMDNCTIDDDIDFFLVTKPRRLWLSRLVVSGIAAMHRRRRSWDHYQPNSWCFNLWLDSDHTALPKTSQSIYHAYEVIQAQPVFARAGVLEEFYQKNRWVKEWVGNWKRENKPSPVLASLRSGPYLGVYHTKLTPTQTFFLNFLTQFTNPILNFADYLSWRLQYVYMSRHLTRERVDRGFAFFHPRDTKKEIMSKISHHLKK